MNTEKIKNTGNSPTKVPETDEANERRRRSLPRRVGGLALSGAATGVIAAHESKVIISGGSAIARSHIHDVIATKGNKSLPHLKERSETRESSEEKEKRMRRLGNFALKTRLGLTEKMARRSSVKAAELSNKAAERSKEFFNENSGGRTVSAARRYKANKASIKELERQNKKVKKAKKAEPKPPKGHKEVSPEEKAIKQAAIEKRRAEIRRDNQGLSRNGKFILEFAGEGSMWNFSNNTGDTSQEFYSGLAKNSLRSGMSYRRQDASIPLLGVGIISKLTKAERAAGKSHEDVKEEHNKYRAGVNTMLWQMGFIQPESSEGAKAKFNPDLEWIVPSKEEMKARGKEGKEILVARIDYDPNNELHSMLAANVSNPSNLAIELEMPLNPGIEQHHTRPYLDMKLVSMAA